MSLLHVLGTVGKDSLKIAGAVIPGPIGIIAQAVSGVVDASTTNKANEEKKAMAVAAVATSGETAPGKLEAIANIVEGVYMILKNIAIIFPPSA